jgi:hypothetical protein
MNRLLEIGFVSSGYWKLSDDRSAIIYQLEAHLNKKNALYAYVIDGVIKYIGKTAQPVFKRLNGYQKPGPKQSTNIRVNANILRELNSNKLVEILLFIDNGLLSYAGYHVNLAAGLEDNLIKTLTPEWNYSGNKRLREDSNSLKPELSCDQTESIKDKLSVKNSFEYKLTKTNFEYQLIPINKENAGFFPQDNTKIEIYLGESETPIDGYIRRNATTNNLPRINILGKNSNARKDFKEWLTTNFNEGEKMLVEQFSPISIKLRKV